MKKSYRRYHGMADQSWNCNVTKEGTMKSDDVGLTVSMDIRAVLHDLLDQQKETNRILRMAFCVAKKGEDDVAV